MDEIAAFINRRGTDAKTIARILREEFKIHYNEAIRIFFYATERINTIPRWNLDDKLENRVAFFSIQLEREREREGRPSGKNEIGTRRFLEKRDLDNRGSRLARRLIVSETCSVVSTLKKGGKKKKKGRREKMTQANYESNCLN